MVPAVELLCTKFVSPFPADFDLKHKFRLIRVSDGSRAGRRESRGGRRESQVGRRESQVGRHESRVGGVRTHLEKAESLGEPLGAYQLW